jgi:hypothetical protein
MPTTTTPVTIWEEIEHEPQKKLLPETLPDEEVHVVQIDFTDFRQVIGDKEALAAFDVGWGLS